MFSCKFWFFFLSQLLGRMGTPEECGKACLFLAADATFCTGLDLLVTGGAELSYGVKNPLAKEPGSFFWSLRSFILKRKRHGDRTKKESSCWKNIQSTHIIPISKTPEFYYLNIQRTGISLFQCPKDRNFIISMSKGPEFHYFNVQRSRISFFLLLSKGPEFHYLNIQMIRINYFSVLRTRISLFLSKGQEFHYLNIQRTKMSLF